jgi:hypothetical protein
MAELPAFTLADFDEAHPQRLYLGFKNGDADMEKLADAELLVQDSRLHVHSAVLSLRSEVLKDLFLASIDPVSAK